MESTSINSVVAKAIQEKRNKKQQEALESEATKNTNKASGDSSQNTSTSTISKETSTTSTNQELEKIENTLDVNRSGVKISQEREDKKKKEEETSSKAFNEAITQQIAQTWKDIGGIV